jgi:hypothetical protein
MSDQRNQKEHEENVEEDFGDSRTSNRDSGEPKKGRDQCHDEERKSPT